MNLYKNHTPRELQAVLEQSAKLTYDAQRNLLQELRGRSLGISTLDLERQIRTNETAIQNLEFLKDLGFAYNKDGQTIKIVRTTWAIVMDIVAILVGLLLFVVGLVNFWMLAAVLFGEAELSSTRFILAIFLVVGGAIGFKMLSGLHRFLDYTLFSLQQSGEMINLRKGGVKGEQKIPLSELRLETINGELILFAGAIEVMRCTEDNLVHKTTMEALIQKMMENQ